MNLHVFAVLYYHEGVVTNYNILIIIYKYMTIYSGYFKESEGFDVCQLCKRGWYQLKTGQKTCQECPQGYYCPVSTLFCKKFPIPGPDDEALKYNYFMLIGLRQRFIKLILFRNSHILPSMVLL